MKISQTISPRIVPALVVGIVAFALLCAFAFLFFKTRSLRFQSATVEAQAEAQVAQAEILQSSAQVAAQTKASRDALTSLAIAQGAAADFIAAVEQEGAAVQAKVVSVQATPPSGRAPGALTLTLQFSGTFAADMRFVALLETSAQASSISSLSFVHDDTLNTWDGSLTLSTLSYDSP